jgi:hypothetical protein
MPEIGEVGMATPDTCSQGILAIVLLDEDLFVHSLVKGEVVFVWSDSYSHIHNGHKCHVLVLSDV